MSANIPDKYTFDGVDLGETTVNTMHTHREFMDTLSRAQAVIEQQREEIARLREIAKASNTLIQFGIRHSAECSVYDGNDVCDCGRDEYVSDHAKAWDKWQRNTQKTGSAG